MNDGTVARMRQSEPASAARDLQFTACRITDWNELAALVRACFPDMPDAEIAWYLVNHRRQIRLLRQHGGIVGFAVNDPSHGSDLAWLEMIGIASSLRRAGMGRLILQDFEAFVTQLGYRRLEFAVDHDNHAAIALYRQQGYELVPRGGTRLTFGRQLSGAGPVQRRRRPGRIERAGLRLLYLLLVKQPVG